MTKSSAHGNSKEHGPKPDHTNKTYAVLIPAGVFSKSRRFSF